MIEPPTIVLRNGDRCVYSCMCITDVVVTDDGRRGVVIEPCHDRCPILRFFIHWCWINGLPLDGLD